MEEQLSLPLADPAGPAHVAANVVRLPVGAHARHALAPRASAKPSGNGPRLGELLGALSLALDMTEGQPAGHCQRSCWIGQQVGRAIGLTTLQMRELYYATLLKDAGCSSNAARVCQLFLTDDRSFKYGRKIVGTSMPAMLRFVLVHTGSNSRLGERVRAVFNIIQNGGEIERELTETRCNRGAQIARQLRFSDAVAEGIAGLDEHWDGSGVPEGLAGEEIPLYSRIALLAQVVDVFHTSVGPQATREEVARRRGRLLDPRLCDVFDVLSRDAAFWDGIASPELEQRLFEMEPARQLQPVDDDYLDDIAMAFGQVVDAKSPFTSGHSARVALVADQVAIALGLEEDQRRFLRRGALLHDVGKLGVSNAILDKPGKLDAWEWAEVQRHALHTEQILSRISSFGALARVAGAHHEKLDGSGYHLGLSGDHLGVLARIIAVADVTEALSADRPYRAGMPREETTRILGDFVARGHLCPEAVEGLHASFTAPVHRQLYQVALVA